MPGGPGILPGTMGLVEMVEEFFSPSFLSRVVEGYEVRESQAIMVREVARIMEEGGVSLVEGGTGVGKTLAYLVPAALFALEADSRVVVSTSTKSLQDQVVNKDLPVVQRLLGEGGRSFVASALKGRNNYLCLHRLRAAVERGAVDRAVVEWAHGTSTGDLETAPHPGLSSLLGSRFEYCLGKACGYREACFYQKAWKRAGESHVLVVNHHLLLSHLVAEKKGLPFFERLVIDEAHRLERTALEVLGESCGLSRVFRQIQGLAGLGLALGMDASFLRGLEELQGRVARSISLLARLLPPGRVSLWEVRELEEVEEELSHLSLAMEEVALQGEGWLRRLGEEEPLHREVALGVGELLAGAKVLEAWAQGPPGTVRWVETRGGDVPWISFHMVPLEVSAVLEEGLFSLVEGVVLTSATLSVAGSMDHIREALGVPHHALEVFLPSEFCYEEQVRLVVVKGIPPLRSPHYGEKLVEAISAILEERGGQSLLLFTAYRTMEEAVDRLKGAFLHLRFYVQGEGGRDALVRAFREDPRGVLVGVESFWEGIDLPGECLRTLVLVKLPFKSPQDPLVAARSRWYEEQGKSPFMDYLLPEAVLVFRQGFGRLIRTREDRGVVYLLDPRVLEKGYGRIFLQSLPQGVQVEVVEHL